MKNTDCTVLVCSCDKYADLLRPFSILWRKHWSDCPFELVLVTESNPNDEQSPATDTSGLAFDRIIACGPGGNWCSRLVQALAQISTPYVLMLCDDYYLMSPVNTALMLKRLAQIKEFDADNLRMIPNPPPTNANSETFGRGTDLLRYKSATAYSIATQAGFWRREFLAKLANGKASIWEFERFGSFDPLAAQKPLLVTPTKEFPFADAVHKGCWEKEGVALLKANNIDYDFSVRGLPQLKTRLVEGTKRLIFALFPWTLIVRIQNLLNVGMKEKQTSAYTHPSISTRNPRTRR